MPWNVGGGQKVEKNIACTDGRQLIRIADEKDLGTTRNRLKQACRETYIQHRGFIDNDEVSEQRILLATLEPIFLWRPLQKPMYGLSLVAYDFAHALSGPAGRSSQ